MTAEVTVKKSFDEGLEVFSKTHEAGDFEEFFVKEGQYLDELSGIAAEHGKTGEEFTVMYVVKVTC